MKKTPRNTKELMVRYAIVSGLVALADYCVLVALMGIAESYFLPLVAGTPFTHTHAAYICQVISSLSSGLLNFWISSSPYVFGPAKTKSTTWGFILFTAIGAGYLVIQMICLKLGDVVGLPVEISKGVGIIFGFLWNFFGRKKLVFGIDKQSEKKGLIS